METGTAILGLLVNLAARSLGLAAAAMAAIHLVRLKSAAAQHAVWTAVTAGMLLMAALGPVLPSIPLRVLPPGPTAAQTGSIGARAVPQTPGGSRSAPAPAGSAPVWEQTAAAVYAAGVLVFLALLGSSYRFTRRLVGGGRLTDLGGYPTYESTWISVPVTVGFFHPKILLPAGWRDWPEEKLAAVMAHEQGHVRRADWAIAAMAGLNRCLFWFHPLAWWLERRLAVLAEQACDDAALLALGTREPYAQALLDMAAAVKTGHGRLVWEAMAMAKTAEVRRRIDRILDDSREIPRAWTQARWAALAACAVPLLYLAAAVQLAPAQQTQSELAQPGSVQFVANTVYDKDRGIYLARGTVGASLAAQREVTATVPLAKGVTPPVLLYKKEAAYSEEAIKAQLQGEVVLALNIGADGRGRVTSVAKSLGLGLDQNAIDAVEQWHFKPAMQNGQPVDSAATVTVNFRLVSAPTQGQATFRVETTMDPVGGTYLGTATQYNPAPRPHSSPLQAAPSGFRPPVLVYKKEPEYTEEARKAKYQGTVVLAVTVGIDGQTHDCRVVKSLGLGLDQKAVEAVSAWKFRPATQDGTAIEYTATLEVNFRLLQ